MKRWLHRRAQSTSARRIFRGALLIRCRGLAAEQHLNPSQTDVTAELLLHVSHDGVALVHPSARDAVQVLQHERAPVGRRPGLLGGAGPPGAGPQRRVRRPRRHARARVGGVAARGGGRARPLPGKPAPARGRGGRRAAGRQRGAARAARPGQGRALRGGATVVVRGRGLTPQGALRPAAGPDRVRAGGRDRRRPRGRGQRCGCGGGRAGRGRRIPASPGRLRRAAARAAGPRRRRRERRRGRRHVADRAVRRGRGRRRRGRRATARRRGGRRRRGGARRPAAGVRVRRSREGAGCKCVRGCAARSGWVGSSTATARATHRPARLARVPRIPRRAC